ncbi:MAG: hypothetical protein LBU79_08765 [Planctomycetota bacterium]|jgi:hypothetical protein|nr:hypothetical protein [Planctomycetota bacterium]
MSIPSRASLVLTFTLLFGLVPLGCGFKRPPANAFPGTSYYSDRVATLKISPVDAYRLAYQQAKEEGQLHFVSRTPTVLAKRWYVFSVPLGSGANLQGYHVNGDNGQVKFMNEKKVVPQTR